MKTKHVLALMAGVLPFVSIMSRAADTAVYPAAIFAFEERGAGVRGVELPGSRIGRDGNRKAEDQYDNRRSSHVTASSSTAVDGIAGFGKHRKDSMPGGLVAPAGKNPARPDRAETHEDPPVSFR